MMQNKEFNWSDGMAELFSYIKYIYRKMLKHPFITGGILYFLLTPVMISVVNLFGAASLSKDGYLKVDSQIERKEYEQELAYIKGLEESLTPGQTNNLEKYEKIAEEIHSRWKGKNKEYKARLMLEVCGPLSSGSFKDDRRYVLARKYALSALADANDIPIETEVDLTGHVVTLMIGPNAPRGQIFEQLRKKDVEIRLHAWKRVVDAIDPNWDPNEPLAANVAPPAGTGLPAGVDPNAIEDTVLRAEYRAAIEANKKKIEKYNEQYKLRKWLRRFPKSAEPYIIRAYSKPPYNLTELNQYLDAYLEDAKIKARIIDAVRENIAKQEFQKAKRDSVGQLSSDEPSRQDGYLKVDSEVPGVTPKVFGQKTIAKSGAYIGYLAFDETEDTVYCAVTNANWDQSHIVKISTEDFNNVQRLSLTESNWEGEPCISPDGKRFFFTRLFPPQAGKPWHSDLYYLDRTPAGWSEPHSLGDIVNTAASEWCATVTADNTLYFGSERDGSRLRADIYRAVLENGRYSKVERLPDGINTQYNDCDPLIAPDESFLIFHSNRPGGVGEHDLYISFKTDDGWSEPKNMGPQINSPGWEMGPSLSRDGRYLFFARRKAFRTDEPSKIYWVSINVIEQFKK